jgi:hypothetical protein
MMHKKLQRISSASRAQGGPPAELPLYLVCIYMWVYT